MEGKAMNEITQKREVGLLNGTPDKRMYWSIISDYDLKTGICELIDNAIDLWMSVKPRPSLKIELILDVERQLIQINDNAGGVREEDLRLLIAPGASRNSPEAQTIGIFGVGSKRAAVALAESILIKTRSLNSPSYQIDITKEWLETPDWDIPHFQIPDIVEGTTTIHLSSLRKSFTQDDVDQLKECLGEIYEWFLQIDDCVIEVNEEKINPKSFEIWAYPPDFEPRRVSLSVNLKNQGKVSVEIIAGLIIDRDPIGDNYGAYFYCNHRLVVKELKTREVGYYVTSEAGVPHPDASLCRAIIKIDGSAKLMPWNSSKSGINFSHPVFQALRPKLLELLKYYSSLSRRFKDDWEGHVFSHKEGNVVDISPSEIQLGKKLHLPELPRVQKMSYETIKAKNKVQIQDQPWTLGLVEAVAAVDIIGRQKLETRSRIALILLDSNFEIALKEFIVHHPELSQNINLKKLFEDRAKVLGHVLTKVKIDQVLVDKAKHYYAMRNKLIHERATIDITDTDIQNYRSTINTILKILFNLSLE